MAIKKAQIKRRKKKKGKVSPDGIVFIKATHNNTIVNVTDHYGNTISWAAAGKVGFKGSRKNTAFAAGQAAEDAAKEAVSRGMVRVDVKVKGPGSGREMAIRSLAIAGLKVKTIKDVTPIPHNGCRPPKRRRV